MSNFKTLGLGVSLAALTLAAASAANAQSTASQSLEATNLDDVVVTGSRGPREIDGAIVAERGGKSRSTVTQEYLSTQQPGQNVLQSLNLQPGVNFTNNDAYGNSGGDLTIRGFDAQRISLNLDGIQLNDTGNYQIYPTQQIDPELLERVSVNQGTTDVDSPTAAATGGTVNLVTRRPASEFGAIVQPSVGTDDYRRFFGLVDTGEFGPWGTSAWLSVSANKYNQFGDNPGELERRAVNGRVYQPIRDNGDFLSVAFRVQEDRNNTYGRKSVDAFNDGLPLAPANTDNCAFAPAGPGRQDQGNALQNPGCNTHYGYFVNPTDSFNVRGQSRFTLTDRLILTIDPQFSYTLANGGGTTNINETDQRLQGSFFNPLASTATGVDLNGDGDLLDTIKLYSPSNTRTNRTSVNTSLIYDINDDHRVRVSYTHDYGTHRQTGEYGFLNPFGDPENVFGGQRTEGDDPILTRDGDVFQKRDRRSIAILNQVALQYVGDFFDNALTVDLGLRAPFFERRLTNNCYQLNTFDAYCSAQQPATAPTAGPPVSFERKYDDVLPNANFAWRFAPNQQVFASYSQNLSSPRTDDLYDRIPASPEPETSTNWDIGYRYQSGVLIASVSAYYSDFKNYIVRGYTELEGGETITTNINAGGVERYGVDGQLGLQVTDAFSVYATASYLGSEVLDDVPGATDVAPPVPTAGKELFEVPEFQAALRAEYALGPVTLGAQAKYVGERWTNLVNDEQTPDYTLVDVDLRYDLGFINEGMYFQVNVLNVFDEEYLGDISTELSGNRTANLGAPRSAVATLRMTF